MTKGFAITKGTYGLKAKFLNVGAEASTASNQTDIWGMRDNKKIDRNNKTYKNGTSVSILGFGGEASIESKEPVDDKGNVPSEYEGTRKISAPFVSVVSKKGKEGGTRTEHELFSAKAAYYFGIDISITLNVPISNNYISPPVVGNPITSDNTTVKTIYVPDEVPVKK